MSNGSRHIIGDECTQSPNQAKCHQKGSLPPLLPLPSTHVVGSYQYDASFRITYKEDNLRCNMSNGTRHIIGDECTQWPIAPVTAHVHHCYHCRALMLRLLTEMIVVPEPPIRGITCVIMSAMPHVISSVTSALNRQIKPTATKMAHCHLCYHCRALMLTILTKIKNVPEPPIWGITCVVISAMANVKTSVTSRRHNSLPLKWLTCTIVTTAQHSCLLSSLK